MNNKERINAGDVWSGLKGSDGDISISTFYSDTMDASRITVLADDLEVGVELDVTNEVIKFTSLDDVTGEEYEYVGQVVDTMLPNKLMHGDHEFMPTSMSPTAMPTEARITATEALDYMSEDLIEQDQLAQKNGFKNNPTMNFLREYGVKK